MATAGTERYVRLMLMTFEGGIEISKKILLRETARTAGSPTIAAFIRSNKTILTVRRNRRQITQKQFEILFPIAGADTQVDDWDLSLLLHIITLFFSSSLTGPELSDLQEIRDFRNEVVCHANQTAIDECEFKCYWERLTEPIQRLASNFDDETGQMFLAMIIKFNSGPLDLQSSLGRLTELCKNDEILKALKELEHVQDQIAAGVVIANAKLDDIHADVKRLLDVFGTENCKESPILKSMVFIRGNDKEVKLAADILLKVLNAAISRVEDPDDDESLINAVKQFLADVEKTGAVVIKAQDGSIILDIKCTTMHVLENIINLFRTNQNRWRQQELEKALSNMFQVQLEVELVLPDETVAMICIWIRDHPCIRTLPMDIQCRSAEAVITLLDYFQSKDSANTLNQLSEVLSVVVNDKVKVEAHLDTQGFLEALRSSYALEAVDKLESRHDKEDVISKSLKDRYPEVDKTVQEAASSFSDVVQFCRQVSSDNVIHLSVDDLSNLKLKNILQNLDGCRSKTEDFEHLLIKLQAKIHTTVENCRGQQKMYHEEMSNKKEQLEGKKREISYHKSDIESKTEEKGKMEKETRDLEDQLRNINFKREEEEKRFKLRTPLLMGGALLLAPFSGGSSLAAVGSLGCSGMAMKSTVDFVAEDKRLSERLGDRRSRINHTQTKIISLQQDVERLTREISAMERVMQQLRQNIEGLSKTIVDLENMSKYLNTFVDVTHRVADTVQDIVNELHSANLQEKTVEMVHSTVMNNPEKRDKMRHIVQREVDKLKEKHNHLENVCSLQHALRW